MPKGIRELLRIKADQALNCLDRMDGYLYDMDIMHQDRQPAITEMKGTLIKGHEQLRLMWQALKAQL